MTVSTTSDFSSTITVSGDRVLVKPVAADKESPGGIILPANSKTKSGKGVVVKSEFDDYNIGATVYYRPYNSVEIELDGEPLEVVDIDQILLVEE